MGLERWFFAIAALLGGTAVGAGAFATHGLQGQLSDRLLSIFETAARYQIIHALALLGVALALGQPWLSRPWLVAAGWCLLGGTLIFSGSLYGLSLTGFSLLGAVAPVGGAALIGGWGCLVISAWADHSPLSNPKL
jgi:uncharacterized membrane protein YgdD (TMEM256/DUF423 family)